MSGYRLDCTINGVQIPFLVDTGAAVTLLRRDTWGRVTANHPQVLESYSAAQLVGVGGYPLTIHGSAMVDLRVSGQSMSTEVVVVSPLTAEAILGLDFLREHRAHIDLSQQQVSLADRGVLLPLRAPSKPKATGLGRIAV